MSDGQSGSEEVWSRAGAGREQGWMEMGRQWYVASPSLNILICKVGIA